MFGGGNTDTILGNDGNDTLFGDGGDDAIRGGKNDDKIFGGSGDDRLYGDSGNDIFYGDAGHDRITGGSGFDSLDFTSASTAIIADLSKHTVSGAGTGNDIATSIEHLIGSGFADTVKGSKLAETIFGGAGDDVIRSLGGSDTLTGGAGNDTFVYFKNDVTGAGGPLGTDHITDFSAGDRLDLHDFLKSRTWADIGEVVTVADAASGSTVAVKTTAGFVDVVTLDGVYGHSAGDLFAAGMLLT